MKRRPTTRSDWHHPDDYLYVTAWHYINGLDAEEARRQRLKAAAQLAPLDVIYHLDADSRWFRVDEVQQPEARALLFEYVRFLAHERGEVKDAYEWMMAKATSVYSAKSWHIWHRVMLEFRVEIAEAIVGEWLERRRSWSKQ